MDGLNLYHGIKSLQKPHLKWLDLAGWLQEHLRKKFSPDTHTIAKILYYTADVTGRGEAVRKRQRAYLDALQGHSPDLLKLRRGKFKRKQWTCPCCKQRVKRPEEKETDVNIAIDMVSMAHQKAGDIFCLLSADTDFMPVLEHIRQNFPAIGIHLVFPPNRLHPPYKLFQRKLGICPLEMDRKTLDQYLLPQKVRFGKRTITRPQAYAPPES